MFSKLFAESGLSLDRLKSFLEVAAAGSIVKAADGDPVRQSQYSRQIKELEDFFRTRLVERQGKGTRVTANGRELARISRFFMMGLSNFQRGCLAEGQTFRIGAGATLIHQYLLPVLTKSPKAGTAYATETVSDHEVERRLHDLTLDFGIVDTSSLSRPLQTKLLGRWRLELCVPRALGLSEAAALKQFQSQELPLILARNELAGGILPLAEKYPARLTCENFMEALVVFEQKELAALLPDYLITPRIPKSFLRVRLPKSLASHPGLYLSWNPRLLRLNPHAVRRRDWLADQLTQQMA